MNVVIAVVTAHNPDERLLKLIEGIQPQVARVILVDDASTSAIDLLFASLSPSVEIVRLHENLGVATAANRGIQLARLQGADFILLLDQDSYARIGLVNELLNAHSKSSAHAETVGMVVPEFVGGISQASKQSSPNPVAHRVIQSGMLVPVRTFDQVGYLREDLFIDLVDFEFESRCLMHGLIPIVAAATSMDHKLGTLIRRPGAKLWTSTGLVHPYLAVSTPFRYYYRVRNRRIINRELLWARPRRILLDSVADLLHFISILLIARPISTLPIIYARGWHDGRRGGPRGRVPDDLAASADSVYWIMPEFTS